MTSEYNIHLNKQLRINGIIEALGILFYGVDDTLRRLAENAFSGCTSTQRDNHKELEEFLTKYYKRD